MCCLSPHLQISAGRLFFSEGRGTVAVVREECATWWLFIWGKIYVEKITLSLNPVEVDDQ